MKKVTKKKPCRHRLTIEDIENYYLEFVETIGEIGLEAIRNGDIKENPVKQIIAAAQYLKKCYDRDTKGMKNV